MENQPTKPDKAVKISIIMGALIVALSLAYYLIIFLPQKETAKTEQQKQEPISEAELKKQSLIDFDKKISDTIVNQDYEKLYELSSESTKKYFSKEEFVAKRLDYDKNNMSNLLRIITNNVQVEGNDGTVDRSYFNCVSMDDQAFQWLQLNPKDPKAEKVRAKLESDGYSREKKGCADADTKEQHQTLRYAYQDNKWIVYDPEPSERSLKASNYLFSNVSKKMLEEMKKSWGDGSTNYLYPVRKFALYLDDNQEELIKLETDIEKWKAEKSRPIINVRQPDIQVQQPIQQPNYPKSCTSSTIGSYTYTNCY